LLAEAGAAGSTAPVAAAPYTQTHRKKSISAGDYYNAAAT
jgi:hypothetical protein